MKLILVGLFYVWPDIYSIGDWLLSWTTDGDSFQVVLYAACFYSSHGVSRNLSSVMGIFPVFMNIIQFWLIDSIVKASTSSTSVHSSSPRNSDSRDCEPLFNSPDDDDDDPPLDIEHGPRSSTSRTTSEGDFKTLVGAEDNKTKQLSGSSSPMTLPRTPSTVAMAGHDYPPNNVGSVSPPQDSTRSRHGFKRSVSPLFDVPIASPPAGSPADVTRNSSRQALLSKLDKAGPALGDSGQFDALEKGGLEERGGGEGRNGSTIHISATGR